MTDRPILVVEDSDEDFDAMMWAVFTSSSNPKDLMASYRHGANSYITKPVQLARLLEILQKVVNYWFCTVQVAPVGGNSWQNPRTF